MADNDKELGKWVATCTIGITIIKQYARGFIIRKRGESITERIKYKHETTTKDMSNMVAETIKPKIEQKQKKT